jgi:hypothetical protein
MSVGKRRTLRTQIEDDGFSNDIATGWTEPKSPLRRSPPCEAMRKVARVRRWRPIFPAAHGRGSVFFYSASKCSGVAVLPHHHHGDHRPHLHLIDAASHVHRGEATDGYLGPNPPHGDSCARQHNNRELIQGNTIRDAGHWHFGVDSGTPSVLFQILALAWVVINYASEIQAKDPRLTIDCWARPPPYAFFRLP